MKILHTSDWHLGHQLYGFDRTEEQLDMLRQITGIVAKMKPDLFLLCGDVFHVSQPSASIQKVFVDAIVGIKKAHPDMTMVIMAGNHDSGTRHEAFSSLWKTYGIDFIGTLSDSVSDHIIEIKDKGFVAAMPYVHERNLPDKFIQETLDTINEANNRNLPVILTAHATVTGCNFKGHDDVSDFTVGTIEAKDVSEFGTGYDYLALGHIHHPQFVGTEKQNVRYSGTPLPVSFDEDYTHSVSFVEIEAHNEVPKVSEILITNPKPLVNLPKEGSISPETAKELLRDFPADSPAYIRLIIELGDAILPSGFFEEARSLLAGKQAKLCPPKAIRTAANSLTGNRTLTISEFKETSPFDIAMRYAAEKNIGFDDDMKQLFKEVITLIGNED